MANSFSITQNLLDNVFQQSVVQGPTGYNVVIDLVGIRNITISGGISGFTGGAGPTGPTGAGPTGPTGPTGSDANASLWATFPATTDLNMGSNILPNQTFNILSDSGNYIQLDNGIGTMGLLSAKNIELSSIESLFLNVGTTLQVSITGTTGSSGQYLGSDGNGNVVWGTPTGYTGDTGATGDTGPTGPQITGISGEVLFFGSNGSPTGSSNFAFDGTSSTVLGGNGSFNNLSASSVTGGTGSFDSLMVSSVIAGGIYTGISIKNSLSTTVTLDGISSFVGVTIAGSFGSLTSPSGVPKGLWIARGTVLTSTETYSCMSGRFWNDGSQWFGNAIGYFSTGAGGACNIVITTNTTAADLTYYLTGNTGGNITALIIVEWLGINVVP